MRFHREQDAQAIVLIAGVLGTLLLGIGIAMDTGQLYVARREAQTAADSAAWAAAVVIHSAGTAGFSASTLTAAKAAAVADALANRHTITAGDVTTPTSGPAAGDPGFVEVSLSTTVRTFFFPGRSVTVRAVAGATRSGAGDVLHVLDPSAASSLDIGNNSVLAVTGSGILVSSTNTGAVRIGTGSAGITAAGQYVRGRVRNGDEGQVTPAGVLNEAYAGSLADPFQGLPGPSLSCSGATAVSLAAGTRTLTGDRAYSSIAVSGGTLTLGEGTYLLCGGGFTVSGSGQVTTTGAGVTVVNARSGYPSGGACGTVSLAGSGSTGLRARPSGSYAGIVLFQESACSGTVTFGGTGLRPIEGTIYAPSAAVALNATVSVTMSAQIVALTVTRPNNGATTTLSFDPARVAGRRVPALVE